MTLEEAARGAIVAGVDGSPDSEQALLWAAGQARLEQLPLTILHAYGPGPLTSPEIPVASFLATMRAHARAVVRHSREVVLEAEPELEVRAEVSLDDPRVALMDASRVAHLVVLGSRGSGPVASLLLGSTGTALIQHAACPVVVRRPHDPEDTGHGILVGIDGTDDSEPAVEWAFHHAELRGPSLTLLHTVFDGLPAGEVDPDEDRDQGLWRPVRDAAEAHGPRHPDVKLSLRVRRGLADEALLEAGQDLEMVVVGSHQRRSLLGLFDNNVPRGVLARAPRLVAVVPGS